MSEITKEEIAIMIDVQSKTVVNLEKIATALKDIVDEQKALTESQKALKDELVQGILSQKLNNMHFDIVFTKYFISSIGILAIVGYIILKMFHV